VYDVAKRRRIPSSYQVRFTHSMSAAQFEIAPEVRRMVRFQKRSLFDDTPLRVIDLIMCRNVFIYFDKEQQAVALERFWGSLSRGGYLILGRSEKLSADMARKLEPIDGKERIYRKPERP
jgi:chemotaxis protein methyltransferase CheR